MICREDKAEIKLFDVWIRGVGLQKQILVYVHTMTKIIAQTNIYQRKK